MIRIEDASKFFEEGWKVGGLVVYRLNKDRKVEFDFLRFISTVADQSILLPKGTLRSTPEESRQLNDYRIVVRGKDGKEWTK